MKTRITDLLVLLIGLLMAGGIFIGGYWLKVKIDEGRQANEEVHQFMQNVIQLQQKQLKEKADNKPEK